jgi:hypothetical protein
LSAALTEGTESSQVLSQVRDQETVARRGSPPNASKRAIPALLLANRTDLFEGVWAEILLSLQKVPSVGMSKISVVSEALTPEEGPA